jgi:hypothetical protein
VSLFQQPSQGDRIDMSELTGSLALFYVHEVRQGIVTSFGEREAVACDVHVLDGPKAGESFENALIFQGALIGSLRSAGGGDPVLARISQGVAKPGQKPPYVLTEFTDADARLAETWIAQHKPGFQQAGSSSPAAAAPSSAAAAPADNGGTVDISALPPEVQELLKQSGAMPR